MWEENKSTGVGSYGKTNNRWQEPGPPTCAEIMKIGLRWSGTEKKNNGHSWKSKSRFPTASPQQLKASNHPMLFIQVDENINKEDEQFSFLP